MKKKKQAMGQWECHKRQPIRMRIRVAEVDANANADADTAAVAQCMANTNAIYLQAFLCVCECLWRLFEIYSQQFFAYFPMLQLAPQLNLLVTKAAKFYVTIWTQR